MEQNHSNQNNWSERFDALIVGGGSTGAVMANRLSENPARRVLLLEAGPEHPGAPMLAAMRNANQPAVVPGLNWKIRTLIKAAQGVEPGPDRTPRSAASVFDYQAGKVLGGSSAVNATQALRGAPRDFEAWADCCGEEWNWAGVLPFFRKLEDDPIGPDGPNALHGRGGPMPIRRERKEDLTPLQRGLLEACLAKGYPKTPDHNDPDTSGVGIIPKNVVGGVRISTAMAYLAAARERPNLTVLTEAFVQRLLWRGAHTCAGVKVEIDDQVYNIFADQVILCAGVMASPGILLRSGIGNPDLLGPLGIQVRAPLAGVGKNFMEHPVVGIWGIPKPGHCAIGEPLRQVLLRTSSSHAGHRNDIHICMMAGIDIADMFPHLAAAASSGGPVGKTLAGLTVCANKSSSRGQVRIDSADPHAMPLVSNNCLGDRSDIPPLKEGLRLAWNLMRDHRLAAQFDQILAWTDGMIESDMALEHAVASFVRPAAHGCGSAKMGSSPRTGAVLDPQGRVFGVDGLWVADASAIPLIPNVPPHLTVLMVAEKIAAGFCRLHGG